MRQPRACTRGLKKMTIRSHPYPPPLTHPHVHAMAIGIQLDAQRLHPVAGKSGPPALPCGPNELCSFLEFFKMLAAEYVVHRQAADAEVPLLPRPHPPQGAPWGVARAARTSVSMTAPSGEKSTAPGAAAAAAAAASTRARISPVPSCSLI